MTRIVSVDAEAWRVPLSEPFAIAGGTAHDLDSVRVRLCLSDGTTGWGEASPLPAFNGENAGRSLTQIRAASRGWKGRDVSAWRPLLEELEERLPKGGGAARAALGMALLDAWTRRARLPLCALFGGAERRVVSDVTVTIVGPEAAAAAATRIRRLGVDTIKIKVGEDPDADAARVRAVHAAHPKARLLLDANQGYGPAESLALMRRLRRVPIALFEQPAHADDWDGLAEVARKAKVPVAADESLRGRKDALALARRGGIAVLNLKLMKMGLLEAWDCALIAKTAGLRLMIGGMVETPLAMGCAAHLAGGLGGFDFVDLDTPLWLAHNPTRGLTFGKGGVYGLASVRSGIGVLPR